MNETKEILHIAGPLASLGAKQMGFELDNDPTLGFPMWGGKDALGNITKFLAKGKPGQLQKLQLTGSTTTGNTGFLKHDAQGNVTGGHTAEITDGYQGTWDASTDTPTLPTAAPENVGWYYWVSVAGEYEGVQYEERDYVISNGATWQRIPGNSEDFTTSVVAAVTYQAIVKKGDPLKVTSSTPTEIFVTKAVAGDKACMAADNDYSGGATGTAIIVGCIYNIDTSAASTIGSRVYVAEVGNSTGFTFTKTKDVYQEYATVLRVGGSDGAIGINIHQIQNTTGSYFQEIESSLWSSDIKVVVSGSDIAGGGFYVNAKTGLLDNSSASSLDRYTEFIAVDMDSYILYKGNVNGPARAYIACYVSANETDFIGSFYSAPTLTEKIVQLPTGTTHIRCSYIEDSANPLVVTQLSKILVDELQLGIVSGDTTENTVIANNLNTPIVNEGFYVNSSGGLTALAGEHTTPFLPIEELSTIKYTGHFSDARRIAFYSSPDEAGFLRSIRGDAFGNAFPVTITTKKNELYFRGTVDYTSKTYVLSKQPTLLKTVVDYLINNTIINIEDRLAHQESITVVQDGGFSKNNLTDGHLNNIYTYLPKDAVVADNNTTPPVYGFYVNSTGGLTPGFSTDYTTEFIKVTPGFKYIYNGYFSDARRIAFYSSPDEAGFLRGISGTAVGNPTIYSFVPEENELYFRASVNVSGGIYSITESTILIDESEKPLINEGFYVNPNGGLNTGFTGDYTTEFIKVTPGFKYTYNGRFTDARSIAFYSSPDEADFLRSIRGDAVGNPTIYSFVPEENELYFRASVFQTSGGYSIVLNETSVKEYAEENRSRIEALEGNTTIDYTYTAPLNIYRVSNDSSYWGRNYVIALHPESFIKSLLPININSSRETLIDRVSKNINTKEITTVSTELSGVNYSTYNISMDLVSTQSSNAKNKDIKLLCVGDSITALDLKYPDGVSRGGWAFPSIVKEMNMKDNLDHGAGDINILMVGTRNNHTGRTFEYKESVHTVRSFSEGQGSRTAASFLRHATHITANGASQHTPEASWQMLGLVTITGHEFEDTTTDKNLMMTTVQQDNWDYGAAIYADMVGSDTYTGSAAQLLEIDNAMDALLADPDIPFYDLATAKSGVGYAFNLQTYLDRYKTLASDGITRLVVGSTAGTLVTDATAYDVVEPTHLNVELGENDRWWYAPTAQAIVDTLNMFEVAIHATHPNMLIAYMNPRMSGPMYPDQWADVGYFQEMSVSSNNTKFDMQQLINIDFGDLTAQTTAKKFILPTYHTLGVTSFSVSRYIENLGEFNKKIVGNTDINHPGIAGSFDMAYQLLAWIYYTV